MLKNLFRLLVTTLLASLLFACAVRVVRVNPALIRGQYYFENGYYKTAMRRLMPAAVEGVPQAQYAVGYMYYYGYGVAQDTDMGYFWMKKSAAAGFPPALAAMDMIGKDQAKAEHAEHRYEIKSEKLQTKGVGPDV